MHIKKKKIKKLKLGFPYLIEWDDAIGVSHTWIEPKNTPCGQLGKMSSIGFLIKKNKKLIVIAPHGNSLLICGEMGIPISSITRIKELKI